MTDPRDNERKTPELGRAGEALRQSEERFRSLIESSRDIITIIDRVGTITYASPSIERSSGFTPEDIVGSNAFEFVHPDDIAHLKLRLAEILAGTASGVPIEFRFRHRNGSWSFVEALGTNRVADPATRGIVLNSRDITDRKLAEESIQKLEGQLQQSQKMEAIGLLAGGIAHDFNNLLTAILGYSELMAAEVGPESPLFESIEEIRKAGERAASLTRQLLAFSRKQVLEPKILDLNALLENLDKMLRRVIGEDVELATILDPRIGRVRADAGQVEQVVMNLAVNARDAMPDGGTLTIETSNVELDEAFLKEHPVVGPAGPYVMLAVTDTGVGMSAETKARIFEPFFTTKDRTQGTGLGLSTVYGIVKQSGGYIWVYSEPGRGTAFKVYLPLILGEEAEARNPESAVSFRRVGGSETILVVEDEDGVRALVKQTLEMNGYTVLAASRGSEALEIARSHPAPIDLLVTDMIMPGMGGTELAEQLLLIRPKARLLFMSGYTEDTMARRGLMHQGQTLLNKPFTIGSLALAVREALDAPLDR